MKIIWSPLALEKLSKIAEHISLDKELAAINWVGEVFEQVDKLSDFPSLGRIVPELNNDFYRELIFGNYRIIYKLLAEEIQILTVRNLRQILSSKNLSD